MINGGDSGELVVVKPGMEVTLGEYSISVE